MRSFLTAVLACTAVAAAVLSCSSGSTAEPSAKGAAELTYFRDIKPIIDHKCGQCHVQGGIAPFALTTPEEVAAHKDEIKVATKSRAMPPWPPSAACGEYLHDRSLTEDQIATIGRWVDGDARAGSAGAVKPATTGSSLSRVDRTLEMPAAYTPAKSPDDYRCFVLDWPETATKYVTGFGVRPGVAAMVHHVIAFLAPPEEVATYTALDAADPGAGYECFGGAGGGGRPRWIGAWAPGIQGTDFPEGTGIKVSAGSKIVLQVHYNTHGAAPAPDLSSVLIRLDDSVAKEAFLMPWTNPAWVFQGTMKIPPRSTDVGYEFALDPTTVAAAATEDGLPNGVPLTVYSSTLHMHEHGAKAVLEIERAEGDRECVLDIPKWNFHWQGIYDLAKPKIVRPGDRLKLSCRWNNQEDRSIGWGEGTSDEMCLGVVYVTR